MENGAQDGNQTDNPGGKRRKQDGSRLGPVREHVAKFSGSLDRSEEVTWTRQVKVCQAGSFKVN